MNRALIISAFLLASAGARAQDNSGSPAPSTDATVVNDGMVNPSADPAGPPPSTTMDSPSTTPSSSSTSSVSASESSTTLERPFEIQPSRHEMTVQLGYTTGFGGTFGSPSGMKLTGDYAYKFHRIAWFDLQLGNTFGFGSKDGRCVGSTDSECYRGGWDFEIAAGVRLKFSTPKLPQLQIEVPLLVGVDTLYNRNCGDNGAAIAVRPGIRAKYFLTPRIGVGIGMNAAFGPGFHSSGDAVCSVNSYTDFYGAFDFMAGAEFML